MQGYFMQYASKDVATLFCFSQTVLIRTSQPVIAADFNPFLLLLLSGDLWWTEMFQAAKEEVSSSSLIINKHWTFPHAEQTVTYSTTLSYSV